MRISDMPVDNTLTGAEFFPYIDLNEQQTSKRNKRALVSTIFGQTGPVGSPGLSAYQVWLAQGNSGTQAQFISSLQGPSGISAYQVWLNLGNVGSANDFINSLKGINGQSTYQLWLALGNVGTENDFINSIMGPTGPSGPPGSFIFHGNGAPNDTLGNNNDYYIDIITGFLYQKSSNTWGSPILDMRGQDGNNILTGFTPPTNDIGNTNDYYLDLATGDLYGPKTNVWLVTPTTNIRGPRGVDGIPGLAGLNGIPGSSIFQGSGVPNNNEGIPGDYYIDNTNGDLYRKSFIGWDNPILNLKGTHGTSLLTGSTIPSDIIGLDGDYYLNTSNGDLYNKNSGSWGSPIGNITGPTGLKGDGSTFVVDPFIILPVNSNQNVNINNPAAFPVNTYCSISDGISSIVGLILSYTDNTASIKTIAIVSGVSGDTINSNAIVSFSGPPGPTGTSITTLAGLSDVNITEGPGIDGYALTYDNTTSKWISKLPTPSLDSEFDDLVKHWFPPSGVTAISGSNNIVDSPFIIFDNDNNVWVMFYYRQGPSIYYVTSNTLEGPWSSETQISSLDSYHQLTFLLDIKGNPVKINNLYHAYATYISSELATTKEIYHFTSNSITGPFTVETKIIPKGSTGSYDGAYTDSPTAIFDGTEIKLYYSGAPDTSQTDFEYATRVLLATSTDPDGPFIKDYLNPVLEPSSSSTDFDYGWISSTQILLRPNGQYLMFYTAGNTRATVAADQPDVSAIGIALASNLNGPWIKNSLNPYVNVSDPPTIFPDNTNVHNAFACYDDNIQRWYLFYCTGTASERNITFSRIDNYSLTYNPSPVNGFGNIQAITNSETEIINSNIHVTPGLYRVRGQFNLISDDTTSAINSLTVSVNLRLNNNTVESAIEYIGNYANENRDGIIETNVIVTEKSVIDFSVLAITGTPDSNSHIRNLRISVNRIAKGQIGRTGAQGLTGPVGIGSQGPTGLRGLPGPSLLNGTTVPNDILGNDDDYYINTVNGNLYQKQSGTYILLINLKGPIGSNGSNGIDGSTWYNGNTTPVNNVGVNGDYYLLLTNGDVYWRQNGSWSVITNIRGPSSENGRPPLITLDTYANRTSDPVIGALHKCSDCPVELYSSAGTTYDKFIYTGTGQVITPYDDNLAVWYNQSATEQTLLGPLTRFTWPQNNTSTNLSIKVKALPSNTPYSKKVCIKPTFPAVQALSCGLVLFDSATGRAITLSLTGRNPQSTSGLFNSPNGFSLDVIKFNDLQGNQNSEYYVQSAPNIGEGIWLNIEDDGTNRYYRYSTDNNKWYNIVVTTNTDYLVPNFLGLMLYQNNQVNSLDVASMLVISSNL